MYLLNKTICNIVNKINIMLILDDIIVEEKNKKVYFSLDMTLKMASQVMWQVFFYKSMSYVLCKNDKTVILPCQCMYFSH